MAHFVDSLTHVFEVIRLFSESFVRLGCLLLCVAYHRHTQFLAVISIIIDLFLQGAKSLFYRFFQVCDLLAKYLKVSGHCTFLLQKEKKETTYEVVPTSISTKPSFLYILGTAQPFSSTGKLPPAAFGSLSGYGFSLTTNSAITGFLAARYTLPAVKPSLIFTQVLNGSASGLALKSGAIVL